MFNFRSGEIFLIDKPLTWTSFHVVNKLKYTIKDKGLKIGHAGTLDPLATGLLIVCTGKFTKQLESYQNEEKEYTGTFTLGATTPSYDLETEINATFYTSEITEAQILETALSFIGEIDQVSPAFSALKIDGERAYEKARRGEEVIIKSRKVTIYDFEITEIKLPEVHFRVVCSKGTYIRSLAFDFGRKLNNGAYLSALCRTRSGGFNLKDAWQLDKLVEEIRNRPKSEESE